MNILFIKKYSNISDEYKPMPAEKNIPDWYKKITPYTGEKNIKEDQMTTATIKKCMPVFDSISAGYLISTYCDIEAIWNNDHYEYKYFNIFEPIKSHDSIQAVGYPASDENRKFVSKFMNAWGIKTPEGYSCLFISPMHRNSFINILPGIVDTDTYNEPVAFPFLVEYCGDNVIIPAGTPIAQVIPFKRDNWSSKFTDDISLILKSYSLLKSVFFNGYKKFFWKRKQYL